MRYVLLSIALLFSGCAAVDHVSYENCESIIARPGHFWESSQSFTKCKEGDKEVFPFGAPTADPLSGLLGPAGSAITSHIVIPVM